MNDYKIVSFGKNKEYILTMKEFNNIKKTLGSHFNENVDEEEFKRAYWLELL